MYKNLAKNSIVGKKLIFMPSCHSTNDICAEMISKGDIVDGTIVITDHQIMGRGQGKNKWESEKEANLTLSVIFKTDFIEVTDQFFISMMVCLALSDLLTEYLNTDISIKWPNDVFYKDKKICGVLIQNILRGNKFEYSILGMGINVNQESFATDNAISMHNITGRWYDLPLVLQRFSEILEEYHEILKSGFYGKLKGMYMNRLRWLNEDHFFEAEEIFEGRIVDIDKSGQLLVLTNDKIRAFNFKEVKFVE